jgi:hypothetical protein
MPRTSPVAAGDRRRRVRRGSLVALALAGSLSPALAWLPSQAATTGSGQPPQTAQFAALNPVTRLTAKSFAKPPQNDMPWARWNFPPDTATIDGLMADLQDAKDHNIAGVEIGQGGVPTTEQLTAIYKKADQLGITVSLKVASALPGADYANTDDYARRTLGNYRNTVDAGATLDTDLPGPTSGNPGTIVAVLAYRCTDATCAPNGTVSLDRSSVVNLTDTVTGTNTAGYQGGSTTGHLNWTAPSSPAGQWVVLTFRAIPFGTTPETLSLAGTKELTTAYDSYFSGGLGALVKQNAGDFFVDSHASDPWGAPEELWASDMRQQFQKRAGYDIVPDLAALVDPTMAGAGLAGPPPADSTFYTFSDGSATRIRSDFNRVRSDMYAEYRLQPFQQWAHGYNMKLRLQQEDGPITSIGDQLQTSAVLDRSEYESLTGSDQADLYRPMASANHMTGNTWYSTECCAVLMQGYSETYQDAIIRMNHEFAGGVNRIVYHIRPYIDTPSTTWPGLGFNANNKLIFANAWNRTEPYWADAASVNDYFARSHMVLTQGKARTDVAVYQRNYSSPSAFSTSDPSNRHWQDLGLQRAGYSWDYLDEHLFKLPNATVTHKRLAVNGPDYKALVFDKDLYPTSNTARGGMTLEAARKFLQYADAGLPIVFVGKPTGTAGLPVSDDDALNALVAQILAHDNVVKVSSEAEVPAALKQLGITPQAKPQSPSNLLSVRREDSATHTNYYWLYNEGVDSYPGSTSQFGKNPSNLYEEPSSCRVTTANNPCMATGEDLDTTVTLEGAGVPYVLDAFSGRIKPISEYTRHGGKVTVPVHLGRDQSTIIALSSDLKRFGISPLNTRVVTTTADSAAQVGKNLVIRASSAGRYRSLLSNGTSVTSTVTNVPAARNLTRSTWQLDAQDWQPTNPYGTTGAAGTATTKHAVSVKLDRLKAWPDIPELADASGIGTYTTTFTLPKRWNTKDWGATLDLGRVTDTFRVKVNGHLVRMDQIDPTADIRSFLKPGKNTLVVRVATTLNNRLSALDPAFKNRGVIQEYGLIGPVVLSPYRQVTIGTK